jgi:hypothetical protein
MKTRVGRLLGIAPKASLGIKFDNRSHKRINYSILISNRDYRKIKKIGFLYTTTVLKFFIKKNFKYLPKTVGSFMKPDSSVKCFEIPRTGGSLVLEIFEHPKPMVL